MTQARILLVEDNPITAKLVRFTLERATYDVVEVNDGASAVEQFRATLPSLVLLDLVLPDSDGFEILRRLRALPESSGVPILAFSGLLSQFEEKRLTEAGFDDVVSKPIEPTRLLQVLRSFLAPVDTGPVARASPTDMDAARTIVLADDDAVQRKMVALRLRRAGFRVAVAADGQEALERARDLKPYAIVSDVLMPRLDGFGLCVAVRNDPELARTPVVLISNSYLDAEDRALAKRAGADRLVLRTTELHDVIELLHGELSGPRTRAPSGGPVPIPELESERIARLMNQLEKQVAMQTGLAQRCSLLSAELSVLSGISEAVATEHDLGAALHQILASCFDAGGISLGLLYLSDAQGLHGVRFGSATAWAPADIAAFWGHRPLLDEALRAQTPTRVPSESHPEEAYAALLAAVGAKSLLIAPLAYRGQALGALVTMSRMVEHAQSDRLAFAQAVASQISLALALARSFQAKDASERRARANAAVLRSILDSMAEGVIVSDARGAITHWNHAATTILRTSPGKLRDIVEARPEIPLARARRGEPVDRADVRIRHDGDAEDTCLSVDARQLADDSSLAHGAVAVFRDVTVERAAAARMLVAERMASLGTLAAGVGHEINNPLMAVLGNVEMVTHDLQTLAAAHRGDGVGEALSEALNEALELLSDAREAAERVRDIVRDLKLFSRSDEESRGEVQVESVLESSIRMVQNEIRHRATLVRDYQPVPAVHANESRLGQVFLNLVVNAAQAIPEGRAGAHRIRVATSLAADGRVRVDVSDTGTGMAPEVAAQIFTPFFTTKPIGVGTGLGLSICHQLISAIGGEIQVETAPGAGTTFSVFLPVHVQPARELPSAPVQQAARARGKILVVDDEPMVATLIHRALARDHDVTSLADGREAVRRIAGGDRFDLILCDLMMPSYSGIELHDELARAAPVQASRVVFMTGGAFTGEARAFLEQCKQPCIDKPIDLDALRAVVQAQLRTTTTEAP